MGYITTDRSGLTGAASLPPAAVLLFAISVGLPLWAQQIGTRAQTLREWDEGSTDRGSSTIAISFDGTLEAHLGPQSFNDGLYVNFLAGGKDALIVKEAGGYSEFEDLSFSADGSRVMFLACPPLGADCGLSKIYTVRIDGTDLTEIADSFYDNKTDTEYTLRPPASYSPDGSNVLLEIVGRRDVPEDGKVSRDLVTQTSYVGLVSAHGLKQHPERLVEGTPLFWSSDSTAIYYAGKDPAIYRIDVAAKQISPTAINGPSIPLLGRVPGMDAIFLDFQKDNFVTVENLDGTPVSPQLAESASKIPLRDSEGRSLRSIEGGGQRQLLLRYLNEFKKPGTVEGRTRLVRFP